MSNTITITVSISPVSSRDSSGGTVRVRIPLVDHDNGEPRTQDELRAAAIARGCERLYGRTAFWWADHGLPGYGQVMRPCKSGGSSAVTYRARLDVEISELPPEHLAALAQRAAEWDEYERQCQREYSAGYSAYAPRARRPAGSTFDFRRGWDAARENAALCEELR